jgi:hypothetical protein
MGALVPYSVPTGSYTTEGDTLTAFERHVLLLRGG